MTESEKGGSLIGENQLSALDYPAKWAKLILEKAPDSFPKSPVWQITGA